MSTAAADENRDCPKMSHQVNSKVLCDSSTHSSPHEITMEIKVSPGPLGIVLDHTITDMAVIKAFVPLPNGRSGLLALHPDLTPGCFLIQINEQDTSQWTLQKIGQQLCDTAQVTRILMWKKIVRQGQTLNPSSKHVPYHAPPDNAHETIATTTEKQEQLLMQRHQLDLERAEHALLFIEKQVGEAHQVINAACPSHESKMYAVSQLTQFSGQIEKILQEQIDAVIFGHASPTGDSLAQELKTFRSSLVGKANMMLTRVNELVHQSINPSSVSKRDFVTTTTEMNSAIHHDSNLQEDSNVSSFSFLSPSLSSGAIQPPSPSSVFSFI